MNATEIIDVVWAANAQCGTCGKCCGEYNTDGIWPIEGMWIDTEGTVCSDCLLDDGKQINPL